MTRLTFRNTTRIRHPEDVARIKRICKERGYKISRHDAQLVWEEYSDSMAVGWLFLPDSDDAVFNVVLQYCNGYTG